ncbi:MAG: O-antigen ligase family protein [Sulfuricella sp.]|nr:O-antigen ligase family protein [Sulfuricella sp.]
MNSTAAGLAGFGVAGLHASSSRAHAAACWLAIAAVLALLFSPPLANLAELSLGLLILASADLRRRVVDVWRQPVARAVLVFYAVICVGLVYSIAPSPVALSMWGGWRKLLLLPLVLALFDDPRWKRRFLLVFVGVVTLCAMVSFPAWLAHYSIPKMEPGVLLRHHATQGMIFGVAAFCAAVLALRAESASMRLPLAACAVLLAANIALVTPGRSGYVVLLVCTVAALANFLFAGKRPGAKAIAGAGLVFLAVVAGLALAPTSRDRIAQAFHEARDYRQQTENTSMGIRMIFWNNMPDLIRQRPLLGYGTGAFGTAYDRLVAGRPGLAGTPTGDPHNQYMKVVAEHGLVGLAAFLAILPAAWRQRPSSPYRLLGLGVLAAWCATSLANSHFSTFSEGSFIYLWLGAMLAEERMRGGQQS